MSKKNGNWQKQRRWWLLLLIMSQSFNTFLPAEYTTLWNRHTVTLERERKRREREREKGEERGWWERVKEKQRERGRVWVWDRERERREWVRERREEGGTHFLMIGVSCFKEVISPILIWSARIGRQSKMSESTENDN